MLCSIPPRRRSSKWFDIKASTRRDRCPAHRPSLFLWVIVVLVEWPVEKPLVDGVARPIRGKPGRAGPSLIAPPTPRQRPGPGSAGRGCPIARAARLRDPLGCALLSCQFLARSQSVLRARAGAAAPAPQRAATVGAPTQRSSQRRRAAGRVRRWRRRRRAASIGGARRRSYGRAST